jgi:hypothetical protein
LEGSIVEFGNAQSPSFLYLLMMRESRLTSFRATTQTLAVANRKLKCRRDALRIFGFHPSISAIASTVAINYTIFLNEPFDSSCRTDLSAQWCALSQAKFYTTQ